MADRGRGEADRPTPGAQAQRHVKVLAAADVEPTDAVERVAPEGAERPGHTNDLAELRADPLAHRNCEQVLDLLEPAQQTSVAVTRDNITAYCANVRIVEGMEDLFDGEAVVGAVAVDGDDDVA